MQPDALTDVEMWGPLVGFVAFCLLLCFLLVAEYRVITWADQWLVDWWQRRKARRYCTPLPVTWCDGRLFIDPTHPLAEDAVRTRRADWYEFWLSDWSEDQSSGQTSGTNGLNDLTPWPPIKGGGPLS